MKKRRLFCFMRLIPTWSLYVIYPTRQRIKSLNLVVNNNPILQLWRDQHMPIFSQSLEQYPQAIKRQDINDRQKRNPLTA